MAERAFQVGGSGSVTVMSAEEFVRYLASQAQLHRISTQAHTQAIGPQWNSGVSHSFSSYSSPGTPRMNPSSHPVKRKEVPSLPETHKTQSPSEPDGKGYFYPEEKKVVRPETDGKVLLCILLDLEEENSVIPAKFFIDTFVNQSIFPDFIFFCLTGKEGLIRKLLEMVRDTIDRTIKGRYRVYATTDPKLKSFKHFASLLGELRWYNPSKDWVMFVENSWGMHNQRVERYMGSIEKRMEEAPVIKDMSNPSHFGDKSSTKNLVVFCHTFSEGRSMIDSFPPKWEPGEVPAHPFPPGKEQRLGGERLEIGAAAPISRDCPENYWMYAVRLKVFISFLVFSSPELLMHPMCHIMFYRYMKAIQAGKFEEKKTSPKAPDERVDEIPELEKSLEDFFVSNWDPIGEVPDEELWLRSHDPSLGEFLRNYFRSRAEGVMRRMGISSALKGVQGA